VEHTMAVRMTEEALTNPINGPNAFVTQNTGPPIAITS